jgi:hypothetical protein
MTGLYVTYDSDGLCGCTRVLPDTVSPPGTCEHGHPFRLRLVEKPDAERYDNPAHRALRPARTGYICRQKDAVLSPCKEPHACVFSQCRRAAEREKASGK